MAKQITSQGTVYETECADTEKLFDEESLAHAGGPVAWATSNAVAAQDQMHEYGGVEDAYHACVSNLEDTLNEWGFDLSTERGWEVIKAASDAFDKRYRELTGYDYYGKDFLKG